MKMKKYLMTGIAALALCVGFTSCSHDLESLSQEEIDQLQAQKIVDNYNKAFKAYVGGEIAANQTWGFAPVAGSRTRTENANANEWADPTKAYGGLKVPPPLTPAQIAVVKAYFQAVPKLGYEDPQWSNYFIQQVYKGNPATAGANSPEQYLAADGSNYILASDHMDHLLAIDPDKNLVDHINNFNHGDCSENGSVLDNGGNANDGPFHSDKIMYMMNSTTKSFAYHNSDGSLYHTEYTGLVSWETIDDWAKTYYSGYDGCLDDKWNRSYMGFDFEQIVGEDVYAAVVDYSQYTAPENQQEGVKYINNFPVTGYKTYEFEGNTYNYLITDRNQYAADLKETSFIGKYGNKVSKGGIADFNDEPNNDVKRELLQKGYLPVDNTANKTWVKVGGTADGYFSDWIVTLTKATRQNEPDPETYSIRVMAEDLSATEASDFDFNDVVFDVEYTTGQSTATITLRAAGGTLPLRVNSTDGVGGFEVHDKFGGYPTTTMINTGWSGSNGANNVAPATETIEFSATDEDTFLAAVKAIRIEVYKTLSTGTTDWFEMEAEQGKPAAKFAVPTTVDWMGERESIKNRYGKFCEWATNPSAVNVLWWRSDLADDQNEE